MHIVKNAKGFQIYNKIKTKVAVVLESKLDKLNVVNACFKCVGYAKKIFMEKIISVAKTKIFKIGQKGKQDI